MPSVTLPCQQSGCAEPPLIDGACYDHAVPCPNCRQPVMHREAHIGVACVHPQVACDEPGCSNEMSYYDADAQWCDEHGSASSVLPCSQVWQEVASERERAHAKHRETSMEQQPVDALLRLSILTEEVGEVAKEMNDARHSGHLDHLALRKELIQVAAMAGAWAAALTPYAQARASSDE